MYACLYVCIQIYREKPHVQCSYKHLKLGKIPNKDLLFFYLRQKAIEKSKQSNGTTQQSISPWNVTLISSQKYTDEILVY